jgi:phosphocarrier protein
MIEQDIEIINKLGLHARAAAKLVACASAFGSNIEIGNNNQWVSAKSIMSVMLLAASKGTVISLRAEGGDAQTALEAVCALINNRFDEEE